MAIKKPDYITLAEACEILNTTRGTLYTYRQYGKGPKAFKKGLGGRARLLYERAEVLAYKRSREAIRAAR